MRETSFMQKDILDVIVEHHQILRQATKILQLQDVSRELKVKALDLLIPVLKMHAQCEEEVLYYSTEEIDEIKAYAFEGTEEHNIAAQLMAELEALHYSTRWDHEIEANAVVLAELVESHMDEEEDEFFPLIRKCLSGQDLNTLKYDYLNRCDRFLEKEPAPHSLHLKFMIHSVEV